VLIEGETGNRKRPDRAHDSSQQPEGESPVCSGGLRAIAPSLLESELFGTLKGAYTEPIATGWRVRGANNGTVFLDEIGDIDLDFN